MEGRGRVGPGGSGDGDHVTCCTCMQHHATKPHSAPRMCILHHASAANAPNHTSTPCMGASSCAHARTCAMHACRNHAPHAHAHLDVPGPVDRLHSRVLHDTGTLQPYYGARTRFELSQLQQWRSGWLCGLRLLHKLLRRFEGRRSAGRRGRKPGVHVCNLHFYLYRALKLARTHLQAGNVR